MNTTNTTKCFMDYPVSRFELDPKIDYYVAVGQYPGKSMVILEMGRQGVFINGLASLTQRPGFKLDSPENLARHAFEHVESEEEWAESGIYVASLAVDGFTAHLRERGPMSELVIGRSDESALPFTDRTVSRRHASVSYRPDSFKPPKGFSYLRVRDLDSMNGTRVTTHVNKPVVL